MKKILSVVLTGVTASALLFSGSTPAGAAVSSPAPRATTEAAAANTLALTVVVAIPSDLTGVANPWTDAYVKQLLDGANTYWTGMTDGAMNLSYPASGYRVVPTSAKSTAQASDFAATVAAEQGFDTQSSWRGLIVLTPATSVVSRAGLAQAASYSNADSTGGSMLISAMGFTNTSVSQQAAFTHELGHFLSIGHANRLACEDGSSDSIQTADRTAWANSTCGVVEYDDTNDLMGSSQGSLNTALAESKGFVKPGDITTVTPSVTPTDYVLKPWGDRTVTNKSLKIVAPDTQAPYYIELRQNVGMDSGYATELRSGVKIVKRGLNNSRTSVVLDPTPNPGKRGVDATQTWEVGDVFVNAEKTFGVRVKSIVNGAAVVTVTKVTPATVVAYLANNKNTAARLTGTLDAPQLVYYSRSAVLTVVSKDASGKAYPGVVTVKEGVTTKATVTVGTSGVATVSLPRATAAGEHNYTLVHSDAAVHTGEVTQTVTQAATTTVVTNATAGVIKLPASTTGGTTPAELAIKVTPETSYAPNGTVTIFKNDVAIGSVPLLAADAGAVTYKLTEQPTDTDRFTVKYSGTANTAGSEAKVTFFNEAPASNVSVGQPVLTVTTSPSSARVKWTTPEVVGKIVKYTVVAKGPNGYEKLFSSTANEVVYTGLTAATRYTFDVTVEAVSLDGTKRTSATSTAAAMTGTATTPTPTPTPVPTAPAPTPTPTPAPTPTTGAGAVQVTAPTNLKAAGLTNTSLYVTWTKSTVVGKVTRYAVVVTNASGYNRTLYTTAAQVSVTGLTAGTGYTVTVTAEAVSLDGTNKATASSTVTGLTKGVATAR
jgi:hypothetical protein